MSVKPSKRPSDLDDWDVFQRKYRPKPINRLTSIIAIVMVGAFMTAFSVPIVQASASPEAVFGVGWGLLIAVLIVVPATAYFFVEYLRTRSLTELGAIRLEDGTEYPYVSGDTLNWYGELNDEISLPLSGLTGIKLESTPRHFRGLSVMLPVNMPNIYLDTRQDIGRVTPFAIDASQRLDLEGNFPSTFRMYAPHGAAVETLSIFQPDVMQVVLQYGGAYDIEFHRNALRIICRHRVYRQSQSQQELENIARAILAEINSRMQHWQRPPLGATPALVIYRYRGIRLGSHYVPLMSLLWASILALPAAVLAAVALGLQFSSGLNSQENIAVALIFACLFGIPAFIILYVTFSRSRLDID